MIRYILFFTFTFNLLLASSVQDKIKSFIGDEQYQVQKNLVDIIFQDDTKYLKSDGNVDDVALLEDLKSSGLLQLFYKTPKTLRFQFETDKNALIFMRVINESLNAMGYNYYLSKKITRQNKLFLWEIELRTEHLVDPTDFSQRLAERGCSITSIIKDGQFHWRYNINTDAIRIGASIIEPNTTVNLLKPIKPYWIELQGAQSISFRSKLADHWYPNIVFFDAALHVIDEYVGEEKQNSLKLDVPKDAKYVKITDLYTLDNIKRGLSVYLRNRN